MLREAWRSIGPEFAALLMGWVAGMLWMTWAWPSGLLLLFPAAAVIGVRGALRT